MSELYEQQNDSQLNKKKRNRKKGKVNEADLMNNFVKNLQSNSEDTCTTENETKSDKLGPVLKQAEEVKGQQKY